MNKRLRRVLDWRNWLIYSHRWLGIAGCVLFIAWFFSGIVMMYARMPTLAAEERLARATPLDLSAVTITPADAAAVMGARGSALQVSMYGDRPVYRFGGGNRRGGGQFVYADTGEMFAGITREQAHEVARRYEPQHSGPLRHDAYLTEPDQWTLQSGGSLPMHRFALDDAAGTELYVSEVTGDVALRTTSRERFWAYLGPVIHWVYFTPLRRNGAVWTQFVIWSSLIGCAMCVAGLLWGVLRFSPLARFRVRREQVRSPYIGLMKWHHYAGLLFGVVTLTWAYSGLLSMGPFDWFRPTGGRGAAQRGGAPAAPGLDSISIEQMRAALQAMSLDFRPKSLEVMEFQGALYWFAERPPAPAEADLWRSPSLLPRAARPVLERRYVAAAAPHTGTFASFPREAMPQIAQAAMPGVPVADAAWLTAYDGYYYDAREARALPVLRVRYADPQQTWLYVDPSRGAIVQRSEKVTRLRRWLYQGLHSLDFPFLYYKRPLWDIVVIALSLGGLALSVTTVKPAWLRLVRHARRLSEFRRQPRRRRGWSSGAASRALRSRERRRDGAASASFARRVSPSSGATRWTGSPAGPRGRCVTGAPGRWDAGGRSRSGSRCRARQQAASGDRRDPRVPRACPVRLTDAAPGRP